VSTARKEESRSKKNAEERRKASEKHDAQFFKDRKAKEEKNLGLTLKLRAQRLAHEASQPKKAKSKSPARRPRAAAADD
jgi:hypothetical protein